jgi:hypothetical protein
MTSLLTGIYTRGKVDLLEPPPDLREGQVRVLLIEDPVSPSTSGLMRFGQFSGDVLPTEEDFKIAEWRAGAEFDELNGE